MTKKESDGKMETKNENWKVTLYNNTDYKHGLEFTSGKKLQAFVRRYYRGEAGNAYGENWDVEGNVPATYQKLVERLTQ